MLGCNHLTAVTVTEGNPWFSANDGLLYSADGKTLLFCPRGLTSTAVKEGTERIGDYAFFYCRALESLTLPASIRHIGSNSISVCEQLRTLHLPEGLVSIGDAAFASSAALTEVNIPSTVEIIGNHAFLGTALETLVLPTGVKSIGAEALAYNPTLNSVTIRSGLTDIGADLCKNSPNVTIWTDSAAAPIYAYAQANGITVRLLNSGSGSSSSGSSGSSGSAVSISDVKNGSVTISPRSASKGDTVTITVKPDNGYQLNDLTVTDQSGNELKLTDLGNGKYTFIMPNGRVKINAVFAQENAASMFSDVAASAYYYEAVRWAQEKGITGGIGNGLFGPDNSCTRAQIVTFLWRAAGSPEPKNTGSFSDVSAGSYYAKAVAWAVENGITTGTGSGKFSPNAACTRAQSVTFLFRAIGKSVDSKTTFSDVPADNYYADAVAWAVENGVTNGIGGGLFGPDNICTRAQIVTFLYRVYQG